jgi:hypothetical protein
MQTMLIMIVVLVVVVVAAAAIRVIIIIITIIMIMATASVMTSVFFEVYVNTFKHILLIQNFQCPIKALLRHLNSLCPEAFRPVNLGPFYTLTFGALTCHD